MLQYKLLLCYASLLFLPLEAHRRNKRSATECPEEGIVVAENEANFRVFITVSALASFGWNGRVKQRKIELNWTPPSDGVQDGDRVLLIRRLGQGRQRVLARVSPQTRPDGYFKTEISFPRNPMLGTESPEASCLFGFYVIYVRDRRTLKVNCIRIRPTWMFEDRNIIGDIPLHSLMIPGTHNAGAYDTNFGRSDAINIIQKFSICQDEDVWTQLLFGVRYLDLRVSYYPESPEKFWIVHDFVKLNPLHEVVSDVRRFMSVTKEMVILDFHRFPQGFDGSSEDESKHAELLRFLISELGEFMAPDWLGRSLTLNELWSQNKTLIVTYSHDPSSAFSDVLWSEVRQVWGNQRNAQGLKSFLSDSMRLRKWARYPWAAMTHLTPTQMDVLLNLNKGMRNLSDNIARNVTKWYRDEWWNSANIAATDFFMGNNLIEESIVANRRRQECRRQSKFLW